MLFLKYNFFIAVLLLSFKKIVNVNGVTFDQSGFQEFSDHPIPFDGKRGYIAIQDLANSSKPQGEARIYIFLPLLDDERVYSLNDIAHLYRTKIWDESVELVGLQVPLETYMSGPRSVLAIIFKEGIRNKLQPENFAVIQDIPWLFSLLQGMPSQPTPLTDREVQIMDQQIMEFMIKHSFTLNCDGDGEMEDEILQRIGNRLQRRITQLIVMKKGADRKGEEFDIRVNANPDSLIEEHAREIFFATQVNEID